MLIYKLGLVYVGVMVIVFICIGVHQYDIKLVFPEWDYNRGLYKQVVYDREYTKFGKWVKKVPGIVSIPILIPYYLVVWQIWVAYVVINSTVSLIYRILFNPII